MRIFFAILSILVFGTGISWAEKRVALVIGNSAYQHVAQLANPKNDAEAIGAALDRLDFKVIAGIDLTREQFVRKIREFARAVEGSDIALFYYAGHGLQVNGRNYLAPIETRLQHEADLEFETLRLEMILAQMERETRTNLVFLDACRNNPLTRNLAQSMGTRSVAIGRGLAQIETGVGTMIAFATQPGNVALDGDGEDANSPFTQALVKHIETPGEDIGVLMRRVRQDVIKKTNGKQVPWDNSSLTGPVVLKVKPDTGEAGDPEMRPGVSETAEGADARKADELLQIARSMPAGVARISALQLVVKRYPASPAAVIAKKEIGQETKQAKMSPGKGTASSNRAEKFDRAKLSALDIDRVIEDSTPKAPASLSPKQSEEALGLENKDIKKIQLALNAMGYDLGSADGALGSKSRKALRKFQLKQRIPQTGYIDERTVTALLTTLEEAPKTYDGKWDAIIYRKWLMNDPNGPRKTGEKEVLVTVELEHRDGQFNIVKYRYRTIEPHEPFSDFSGSISSTGKVSLSGSISYRYRDANNIGPRLSRMKFSMQLPRVVPVRYSFGKSANRIDRQIEYYVSLSRKN